MNLKYVILFPCSTPNYATGYNFKTEFHFHPHHTLFIPSHPPPPNAEHRPVYSCVWIITVWNYVAKIYSYRLHPAQNPVFPLHNAIPATNVELVRLLNGNNSRMCVRLCVCVPSLFFLLGALQCSVLVPETFMVNWTCKLGDAAILFPVDKELHVRLPKEFLPMFVFPRRCYWQAINSSSSERRLLH